MERKTELVPTPDCVQHHHIERDGYNASASGYTPTQPANQGPIIHTPVPPPYSTNDQPGPSSSSSSSTHYTDKSSIINGGPRMPSYGTGSNSLNGNYPRPPNQNQTSNVIIPPPTASSPASQNARLNNFEKKSLVDTYLLAVVFGLIGAHHFYLQRYRWGVLYFFTLGLLGCGYVIDIFRVPYLVRKYNRERQPHQYEYDCADDLRYNLRQGKDLSDAYVAWFPFGLLGFHHYYLGNYRLGVVFTLTFGVLGLGWLIDGVRMPYLVKEANTNTRRQLSTPTEKRPMKSLCLCYVLALPPFGWLGLHHFYMNRPFYGYAYVLSLGQFGVGWFIDLLRMPALLRRCNDELKLVRKRDVKTVDDCYVMWFPFGLIGFHHYYLGRLGWGALYTVTFGILGIGWLIDFVRIPCLVRDVNRKRDEMEDQLVEDLMISAANIVNSNGSPSSPQSMPFYQNQNAQSGYNTICGNSFSNNNTKYHDAMSPAPLSNDRVDSTSSSSNGDMRLPGQGALCYTPVVGVPPAYSPHERNAPGKSPPPYTE